MTSSKNHFPGGNVVRVYITDLVGYEVPIERQWRKYAYISIAFRYPIKALM